MHKAAAAAAQSQTYPLLTVVRHADAVVVPGMTTVCMIIVVVVVCVLLLAVGVPFLTPGAQQRQGDQQEHQKLLGVHRGRRRGRNSAGNENFGLWGLGSRGRRPQQLPRFEASADACRPSRLSPMLRSSWACGLAACKPPQSRSKDGPLSPASLLRCAVEVTDPLHPAGGHTAGTGTAAAQLHTGGKQDNSRCGRQGGGCTCLLCVAAACTASSCIWVREACLC